MIYWNIIKMNIIDISLWSDLRIFEYLLCWWSSDKFHTFSPWYQTGTARAGNFHCIPTHQSMKQIARGIPSWLCCCTAFWWVWWSVVRFSACFVCFSRSISDIGHSRGYSLNNSWFYPLGIRICRWPCWLARCWF